MEGKRQEAHGVSLPTTQKATMRVLLLLSMPVLLLAQPPLYQEPFPFLEDYGPDYLPENPDTDVQQQVLLHGPRPFPEAERPGPSEPETEPTEPGPLDCREEQYPCTRLYSVHKPCKQCLNSLCFYSLRRVYVINKEVCVRTVCAHEELLRADMCRDQFSRCGVAAVSGQCGSLGSSCGKSCGGC
ncbi:microfibrillar-associated protein 2 isoform X2 [Salmo salar]|uniref:Microfibrillar-associated protein 2 isoform X2 n=1 Tax=Salmo salar TaxID=8030 RepID=A0A1S3P472_SALSA|nr:microfibrillar-associated protein 2 isoform X2 [Salmo salar]|eukprot:XP_014022394.1 PREDICTED: microfibrillar-associated protein 2 isoform X1 [Salmo salar]